MAPTKPIVSVAMRLRGLSNLQLKRNKTYGAAYKDHGFIVQQLFNGEVRLRTSHDHTRFGLLTMIISKVTRYCRAWFGSRKSRCDSLRDLAVYAVMLLEIEDPYENAEDEK